MIKLSIDTVQLNKAIEDHIQGIKAHFQRYEFEGSKLDCWNSIDKWLLDNISLGFEDILRATHEELKIIIEDGLLNRKSYPVYILDIKNSYEKFATIGGNFGGKGKNEKWNAYSLVRALDVNVCPYCNRNYISNLTRRKKRTCQLDHYFNKNLYPFLALSFYNLIPSCGPCNHIKSTSDISVSPYQAGEIDHLIGFEYLGSITRRDLLKIELKVDEKMKLNKEIFGLDELYDTHKDYLIDILLKKETYPDTYLEEILKNYPNLYKNKDEILNVLYSNYLKVDDFQKRPLAKFTADILKHIK